MSKPPKTAHGGTQSNDVYSAQNPGETTAFAVATRLSETRLHPVNISADLLAYALEVAQKIGISHSLLLAILWQEQQWTQNQRGLLGELESRVWNTAEVAVSQSIDPAISLGITHMKLPTARMVAAHFGLTVGDIPLASMNDADLASIIARDRRVDVNLAAHYLIYLQQEQQPGEPKGRGASTDEDLFILYAADTSQVREYNALYGSGTAHRSGGILPRMEGYAAFTRWLSDADYWESLTPAQRQNALDELASVTARNQPIALALPYPVPGTVQISATGLAPDAAQAETS